MPFTYGNNTENAQYHYSENGENNHNMDNDNNDENDIISVGSYVEAAKDAKTLNGNGEIQAQTCTFKNSN